MKARPAAPGGDETERCAAITVQAQRAKPSTAKNTKNHKGTQRARRRGRAVRVRKAHVWPGGLKGHGGLRTPCFGFGESSGVSPVL